MILATKSGTPIIGQVASVMGWIMDGIYKMLDGLFGVQNLGICIIIFSIIIYALMTPLQIKQQKFSKLSAFMQPELQKVQKKYQGKRDQVSMQKMNEETQAIYQKYGVSPTGSCVQLAIQFPILMALWQVIYKIPAYVGSVKDIFTEAVSHITAVDGYTQLVQNFITDNKITRVQLIMDGSQATSNSIIDFLYALSPSQWEKLATVDQFSGFSGIIDTTAHEISKMQNFFGLNIADQPMTYIKAAFTGGAIILAIAALMIPILSWVTQMLNIKLMPQAAQQDGEQNAMMNSMKMMNTIMPLMSAIFCFTFPVGLGIYWISSAVVRSIQQLLINRHMDRMNIDDLINENMKKMEKKREKAGLPPQKITNQAHQNVKNINNAKAQKGAEVNNAAERARKVEQSYQNAAKAKPGSITAKANMVRDFDERNRKK
ncbi:MAG: membrane protein insertase YidC [Clostridiales bacterium]|nr:membrane protein insertase YidC [Clostridiales bacterium]MBS6116827.1 membrane protein insertase YidC [Clostridiales bacterium]